FYFGIASRYAPSSDVVSPAVAIVAVTMPIVPSAAIASVFRARCQVDQHSACSHVCVPGSVPNGSTTALRDPALPHHAQRPGADGAGCWFSHSTMQQANA